MQESFLQKSGLLRLLLLGLVALPPLFAGLGAGDSDYHMEVRALQSAQETWFRQDHDGKAWLIPTWNGEPRINKPPLAVWVDLLAWRDLAPDSTRIDQLVWRARAAAAALAALMVLAVFLTGRRLRDAAFGGLAAAATGTTLFFLRQSRLASYDTYFMALAGHRRLRRPLRAGAPGRRRARRPSGAGWSSASRWAWRCWPRDRWPTCWPPRRWCCWPRGAPERKRLLAGAGAGLLLSVAVAAPWYALPPAPRAGGGRRSCGRSTRPAARSRQPFWYYAGLLALVAPWCLWLPAGLWSAARRGGCGAAVGGPRGRCSASSGSSWCSPYRPPSSSATSPSSCPRPAGSSRSAGPA
jgi:hypothetical protein